MRSVAFLVAVTLVGGCSLALDFDSRPDGDLADGSPPVQPGDDAAVDPRDSAVNPGADTGIDASADAPEDCSLGTGKGPMPVRVGSYCIDSTEVTNAQYRAFLANLPPVDKQDLRCTGNTWPSTQPPNDGFPVVNVDWCDAVGFCTWAGKRLCGNISGGSTTSPATSQWYQACSMGAAALNYPYGDTYDAGRCAVGAFKPAGPPSTCTGGYPGLFDMSANVSEWEDDCAGGKCAIRGGAVGDPQNELRCDFIKNEVSSQGDGEIGFRCCSLP